jgi:hypothetical protein
MNTQWDANLLSRSQKSVRHPLFRYAISAVVVETPLPTFGIVWDVHAELLATSADVTVHQQCVECSR